MTDLIEQNRDQMPRPKIIGMRNVLVHGYFDIDSEIVWQAVTSDLPGLRAAIEALLQKIAQRNA